MSIRYSEMTRLTDPVALRTRTSPPEPTNMNTEQLRILAALISLSLSSAPAVAARISHRSISPYPAPIPPRRSVLSIRAALRPENSSLME